MQTGASCLSALTSVKANQRAHDNCAIRSSLCYGQKHIQRYYPPVSFPDHSKLRVCGFMPLMLSMRNNASFVTPKAVI